MTITRLPPLGAPGIYYQETLTPPALTAVRLDVCAFAGVAPRGPAWVPIVDETWAPDDPTIGPVRPRVRSVAVAVDSWDDYLEMFGGHEGPGRLPLAVAAFFENGGRRALVIRIVAADDDPVGGVATGAFDRITTASGDPVTLLARSQGAWGDGLEAVMTFDAEPVPYLAAAGTEIDLPDGAAVPIGSTLRLAHDDGTREWRTVTMLGGRLHQTGPGATSVATVDTAIGAGLARIDVVTARIEVTDGDMAFDRTEVHDGVGLSPLHPNWLARRLFTSSALVFADEAWLDDDLRPVDFVMRPAVASGFTGGEDRYRTITPDAFFDRTWLPGNTEPGSGVQSLAEIREVAMLAVPDLYSPVAPPDDAAVFGDTSLAGPEFEDCVTAPEPVVQEDLVGDLDGLYLDPASQLDVIRALQKELISFAELVANFVVLLEVPPGLDRRSALAWRGGLASSYAAAYYPWLFTTVRTHEERRRVLTGPAGAAAGIIARRELVFGVPHGPANEIAAGIFDVEPRLSPGDHAALFAAGINCFMPERDGIRLTSARTLSVHPAYRQLTVRRLMTLLRRSLEEQTQWIVFEPNNRGLWADVTNYLRSFLRQLFIAGAFRGATEEEAFFVRCDESTNPRHEVDTGRLIAEVGVAPSEPIEFIVLTIQRDGDSTVRVEEHDA